MKALINLSCIAQAIEYIYFDITLNLDSVRFMLTGFKLILKSITTTDSYLTPFADDNSMMEPPDPFPNSEVKHHRANGSVGSPM